jgi:two-component system, NarL family, sensor kinase
MTIVILVLTGIIFTILYIHQNRRISYHEHLVNMQLEIQEETFQQISREIHDNIGLSLTLAKLYLNTLNLNIDQKHASVVESSIELIGQSISDLSYISKSFNSEAIQTEGFLSALKIKLEKINTTKQYTTHLNIIGEPVFMDSQNELIVYRIAQEALNNIIKHSKATEIKITLIYTQAYLTLKIQDNGIGINWQELEKIKSSKMSAGLNNMKKRAKMINGTFDIKSTNQGTKISVTIPFQINEK